MRTMIQVPMRTYISMLPRNWLGKKLELGKAACAGATVHLNILTIAAVAGTNATSDIPENEYLAFTIVKSNGKGGYKQTQSAHVYYANVDTGVQVSCVTTALLRAFPKLDRYFVAGCKGLVGIGGAVKSVGMLEKVPVHLGD